MGETSVLGVLHTKYHYTTLISTKNVLIHIITMVLLSFSTEYYYSKKCKRGHILQGRIAKKPIFEN